MVYVVERYLPGVGRTDLLPGLSRLQSAIEELRGEGTVVRYLGSTIVLGDEACFCQFEGPSETAVAQANRRAGLPFDRIVPALLVHSTQRRGEMSVSTTSVPRTTRLGPPRRIAIIVVLTVLIGMSAYAIATYAFGSGGGQGKHGTPTQASVTSTLTPQQWQYVLGIAALTPAQLAAAFGTGHPAGETSALGSLTPKERRYVEAIASMSSSELAAAFGTGK